MNLRTVKNLTRRSWTSLPMPREVIDRVNNIGEADRQPSLLTLATQLAIQTIPTQTSLTHQKRKLKKIKPVPEITGVDQEPPDDK